MHQRATTILSILLRARQETTDIESLDYRE